MAGELGERPMGPLKAEFVALAAELVLELRRSAAAALAGEGDGGWKVERDVAGRLYELSLHLPGAGRVSLNDLSSPRPALGLQGACGFALESLGTPGRDLAAAAEEFDRALREVGERSKVQAASAARAAVAARGEGK